jgi:hypothetical protein
MKTAGYRAANDCEMTERENDGRTKSKHYRMILKDMSAMTIFIMPPSRSLWCNKNRIFTF